MSFNYLEIAKAAAEAQAILPDEVVGVEIVEFPLPAAGMVADLNVALRLASRRTIAFSLKTPWTGLYVLSSGAWRTSKAPWATAFGEAQDWNAFVKGARLLRLEALEGERVVRAELDNGTTLELELFPARPNWILKTAEKEYRWREASVRRPGGAPSAPAIREFERPGTWMERVYHFYLEARRKAFLAARVQAAIARLQSRIGTLAKTRVEMNRQLAEAAGAEELRERAEALKGKEDVDKLFAQYKKLKRTRKEVESRMTGVEEETRRLTSSVARLRGFEGTLKTLEELLRELGLTEEEIAEKKPPKRWREAVKKHGLRRYESKEGLAIWVGRDHEENEELVIRLARGNDLWMHLKGRPGAHVIIQLPAGKSPSLETLLDGAALVAYYSGAKESEKLEVDYTFRKNVKRVPGRGEKFLVTYSQNKTLLVKLDEARLARLLKGGRA
jgi:predicted ribosome quality control (RQC) complex YloA/Tae2 family protein